MDACESEMRTCVRNEESAWLVNAESWALSGRQEARSQCAHLRLRLRCRNSAAAVLLLLLLSLPAHSARVCEKEARCLLSTSCCCGEGCEGHTPLSLEALGCQTTLDCLCASSLLAGEALLSCPQLRAQHNIDLAEGVVEVFCATCTAPAFQSVVVTAPLHWCLAVLTSLAGRMPATKPPCLSLALSCAAGSRCVLFPADFVPPLRPGASSCPKPSFPRSCSAISPLFMRHSR